MMMRTTKEIGEPVLHLVIFGILLFQNVLVGGLKLRTVFVPESGLHGGAETLKCDFDQESDELLSLKWYKNDNEFFRYLPHTRDHVETFPTPGFIVQKNNATLHAVTIRNLTLDGTGVYKCEILADKTFQTLSQERNFTVIVPPQPDRPIISNVSNTVYMGQTIIGNCSSFFSKPPAELTFYINEEKVEGPALKHYSPVSTNGSRFNERMTVYTSTLGINFRVDNKHFRQGMVTLKCIASIGKRRWIQEMKITHRNFISQFSSSQQSIGIRAVGGNGESRTWLLLFVSSAAAFLRFHEIMD